MGLIGLGSVGFDYLEIGIPESSKTGTKSWIFFKSSIKSFDNIPSGATKKHFLYLILSKVGDSAFLIREKRELRGEKRDDMLKVMTGRRSRAKARDDGFRFLKQGAVKNLSGAQ